MSRKKHKQKSQRAGRGVFTTARVQTKRALPLPLSPLPRLSGYPSTDLKLFEDRRQFHPLHEHAPARSFTQSRHRLAVRDKTYKAARAYQSPISSQTRASLVFQSPSSVLICARRNIRKEVLHALNKTGKTGQNKPRFNEYSTISCRKS